LLLDIIGVSTFGKDFQTLYNSDDKLASVYKQAFDPTPEIMRYFAAAMILPSGVGRWIPMSGNRKITRYSAMIRKQCRELIDDKKSALEESDKGRPDILSVLLNHHDLSDEAIQDQMLTFLAAGCVKCCAH
jgi:cytochrome P450